MNIPLSHWIVFVGACAFVGWLNGRRATPKDPVQTSAKPLGVRAPCGCEYRDGQWIACRQHRVPRARPSWISETDFCGCCGRPAVVGQLWCFDCAFHIDENAQQPHDRTYYAQHSEICPFTDEDEGDLDVAPDAVPEGLGVTPAPRPSRVSAICKWSEGERKLWDEIRQRVAR